MTQAPLIDPFMRPIEYLRISVTDRCDFRCTYCMSENMTFLPKADLLTLEELHRMATGFIDLGVRKIRITGGEPLVRRDIMSLFELLGAQLETGRLEELTLTTNGSQLGRFSETLYKNGVRRVNISLDTLNPEKFRDITRWGRFEQVMSGIEAAKAAGLRIKINMVAMKGVNDDEVFDMLAWCAENDFDLTFIEVMPMGDIGEADRLSQYFALTDLRKLIETRFTTEDLPLKTGGPARYVALKETGQTVGFITPLSHNFCESCNRVRVTCTGELFMCLGQEDKADLRAAIRNSEGNEALYAAIRDAISRKPKGHDFDYSRQAVKGTMSRNMSHTGG